jgi:hypothetical protein
MGAAFSIMPPPLHMPFHSDGARQRGDGQPVVCVKGWPRSAVEGWPQAGALWATRPQKDGSPARRARLTISHVGLPLDPALSFEENRPPAPARG